MDMEVLSGCEAWTKASLQRFAKGPQVMMTLSRFLEDRVELEGKMKKCRNEFFSKWDKRAARVGSNMPRDDVGQVMRVILDCEEHKANYHSDLIYKLHNRHGPMTVLNDYIYHSSCMVDIINTKRCYNEAMGVLKKLENNIKSAEKSYFQALKKEEKMLLEVDELEKSGNNSKVRAMADQLHQLTCNTAKMLDIYTKAVEAEKKNRDKFQNDMKEFHSASSRYEATRLETVKITLQTLLQVEKDSEEERKSMKKLFSQGLACLEKYDIQSEIAEFDQLCSYQHQFPLNWCLDGLTPRPTTNQQKNDEENTRRKDKHEDEVEVLMVPKVVKSTRHFKEHIHENQRNVPSTNPFEEEEEDHQKDTSTNPFEEEEEEEDHQLLPSTNPFEEEEDQPATSTNPFEEEEDHQKATSTNPFEEEEEDHQKATSTNPFEEEEDQPATSTNPFEEEEEDHQKAACTNPFEEDDNTITDSTNDKAPRVKTTTIESDSSSSEGELSPRADPGLQGHMKVKVYGIKSFIARTEGELSFKRGGKVYMTVAENSEGMGYGYVKKGKLKRKKVYGSFPAKLVSPDAKKRSAFKPPNLFRKSKKAVAENTAGQ